MTDHQANEPELPPNPMKSPEAREAFDTLVRSAAKVEFCQGCGIEDQNAPGERACDDCMRDEPADMNEGMNW